MKRFASTRSESRASQPSPGRAQCSVGSIDEDGIRYGLTTHALIASTIRIAPAIVTIQSSAIRAAAREAEAVDRVAAAAPGSGRRAGRVGLDGRLHIPPSGRRCAFGGQYVANTGPIRFSRGTEPQTRESHDSSPVVAHHEVLALSGRCQTPVSPPAPRGPDVRLGDHLPVDAQAAVPL